MLVKYIGNSKRSWEDYLDQCVYAYNTARHESSQYTPFELMFSRKAVVAVDVEGREEPEDALARCLPEKQTGMHCLLLIN